MQKSDPVSESTDMLDHGMQYGSQVSMRHDMVSEKAVEIGIRLQDILGTSDAANFLKNNVIDFDVALRVLLRPQQRRKS